MKCLLLLVAVFSSALCAPSGRVTGGVDAEEGQFPYQISLQWGILGFYQHVCGGTIIAPGWILTAGHCVTELPFKGNMKIRAGITGLKDSGAQVIDVVERIVHPNYNGGVNPNDIALLKLAKPLQMNDKVQAATLPEADAIPTGSATLSGWGSVSTTVLPSMPTHLQTVELPLLSHNECKAALVALTGQSEPLRETNVCTGPLTGGLSACSGDSGGPLAQDGTIIGVVSWGMMPCGSKGAPSVYTQVSNFLDFINEHVE